MFVMFHRNLYILLKTTSIQGSIEVKQMDKIEKRIQKAIQKGKWSSFVGLKVQQSGGVCSVCGSEVEYHHDRKSGQKGCVHHQSSDRWDVIVVCDKCHRKIHQG